ncbi:class I SAM-dependent methyltransferase [Pseudonocardia sp. CA-107938]|uniref:class I SAM-dependent methyltransferase n=1 Tax=Pseudonocardia sp. CA-107938 TaxID=3240021 RepID=UPI003D8A05B4
MARDQHTYLPAMSTDRLLRLYDPLTRLLGVPRLHSDLVEDAEIAAGHQVLEIGCGTGNLALMIARRHPDAHVTGLDPDPHALDIARAKAGRAGVSVQWDQGSAAVLPYPDASIDRVVSALMFHHLRPADRARTLEEVRRVLRPGAQVHLVDIVAHGPFAGRFSAGGTIPELMRRAGLRDVRQASRRLRTTAYRAVH